MPRSSCSWCCRSTRSRLSTYWEGFSVEWYAKAATNPAILGSLRNSLIVAFATTVIAATGATAAALAFHRHRFRQRGLLEGLLTIPTVAPEIVLAASMLLLFASLGLRLGFLTIILSHVAFTISYAFVIVKARIAGFDDSLEEAAMDLGAGPVRTFFKVTLPSLFPAVMRRACSCLRSRSMTTS
jgi:spermidine/putrescine transport system permease protein